MGGKEGGQQTAHAEPLPGAHGVVQTAFCSGSGGWPLSNGPHREPAVRGPTTHTCICGRQHPSPKAVERAEEGRGRGARQCGRGRVQRLGRAGGGWQGEGVDLREGVASGGPYPALNRQGGARGLSVRAKPDDVGCGCSADRGAFSQERRSRQAWQAAAGKNRGGAVRGMCSVCVCMSVCECLCVCPTHILTQPRPGREVG